MRKQILNQPIDIVDIERVKKSAKNALICQDQFKIITLNPEMVINALSNKEFENALKSSHLIVPDGTGIVWALKLLNPKDCQGLKRIPGIELAESILEEADKLSKRVAIYGGRIQTLEKVINILMKKFSNIIFVKSYDGYQGEEHEAKIAKEIANNLPDVVLVALGTPKQEIWINRFANLFPKSILIGIGGSLDVWSGKKPRAPKWIRDIHLEWLFRTITDPARIPRVLRSLPKFVLMVIKSSLQTKQVS